MPSKSSSYPKFEIRVFPRCWLYVIVLYCVLSSLCGSSLGITNIVIAAQYYEKVEQRLSWCTIVLGLSMLISTICHVYLLYTRISERGYQARIFFPTIILTHLFSIVFVILTSICISQKYSHISSYKTIMIINLCEYAVRFVMDALICCTYCLFCSVLVCFEGILLSIVESIDSRFKH